MLAQRYQKKMLKCNKNNYKSTRIRPFNYNYSLFVDL